MQCFSYIKWDSREQLVSTKPRKSLAQHSSNHWAQHICSTHLIHHIISFSPVTTIPKLHYVYKFQRMHVEYELKISACHPSSGNVSFFHSCATFAREEHAEGRRDRARKVKYFTTFRPDGYKRHLSIAHLAQWVEYHVISNDEDKEHFFSDGPVAFARCTP
jgi:hypothetical protein